MALIDEIKRKIDVGEFEFSKHAVDQSILRRISVEEVREVFGECEVIEDYPNDKYGPSCLVFGKANSGRPLHVQCSYPVRPLIKIITVYEPDPDLWIDFKTRRLS